MIVIKGHKRGLYTSRLASTDSRKLVSSVIRSVEFKEKHYFELTNGNLILETWKDIYECYAGGVAPNARKEVLAKTTPSKILEIDLATEGFLHLSDMIFCTQVAHFLLYFGGLTNLPSLFWLAEAGVKYPPEPLRSRCARVLHSILASHSQCSIHSDSWRKCMPKTTIGPVIRWQLISELPRPIVYENIG